MNFEKLFVRFSLVILAVAIVNCPMVASAAVVQSLFDDFSDGDRSNDGVVAFYDTDFNLSGTLNDAVADDDLNNQRNLTEVTAPEAGATPQSGIIWHGTRGFTSSNTGDPKANLKIFDDSLGRTDNLAGVTETNAQVLGTGYALGYESKGTGSSMVGVFGESIAVGPNAGDKVVVSLDIRFWRLSNNPEPAPNPGEIRWGLFQDTDNELGQFANEGLDSGAGQASVEWGAEDGDWRDSSPGPEGDKGIYTRLPMGPAADPGNSRINWEWNVKNINGTSNNGRFLEGSGVSNTPGSGGDVGTVASPGGNGPGGTIPALGPHEISMEIVRLDNGLVEVASFVNGLEILRDEIKVTDTGFGVIGPPADSFDYFAFRNSSGNVDYVIDNFSIQSITIPEPSSILLLSLAACLMGLVRRRR